MRENIIAGIIRFFSRLLYMDALQEEPSKSSLLTNSNNTEISKLNVNHVFSGERMAMISDEDFFKRMGKSRDFTIRNMDEQGPFRIGVLYRLYELIQLNNPCEEIDFVETAYFARFWNNTNSGYYAFIWCLSEELATKNVSIYEMLLTKMYEPTPSDPNHCLTSMINENLNQVRNILTNTLVLDENTTKEDMDVLALRLRIIIWSFYNLQKDEFLSNVNISSMMHGLKDFNSYMEQLIKSEGLPMEYPELYMLSEIFCTDIGTTYLCDDAKSVVKYSICSERIERSRRYIIVGMFRLPHGYYIPTFGNKNKTSILLRGTR